MEPLRDWLIGRGWTSELATIAAVLAAFLVAYLIGWILRLTSGQQRAGGWKLRVASANEDTPP
jgi:hypothetical protein